MEMYSAGTVKGTATGGLPDCWKGWACLPVRVLSKGYSRGSRLTRGDTGLARKGCQGSAASDSVSPKQEIRKARLQK